MSFFFVRSKLVGMLAKNRRTQQKLLPLVHKHKVGLTKIGHNFREENVSNNKVIRKCQYKIYQTIAAVQTLHALEYLHYYTAFINRNIT